MPRLSGVMPRLSELIERDGGACVWCGRGQLELLDAVHAGAGIQPGLIS